MTTSFDAQNAKQVFLPTTANDYGSMIYSLLEQQLSFIAAKEGADVRTAPGSRMHACDAPRRVPSSKNPFHSLHAAPGSHTYARLRAFACLAREQWLWQPWPCCC